MSVRWEVVNALPIAAVAAMADSLNEADGVRINLVFIMENPTPEAVEMFERAAAHEGIMLSRVKT